MTRKLNSWRWNLLSTALVVASISTLDRLALAEDPEPMDQRAFGRMVEYLTRDGGRWKAPNTNHQAGNPRSPDAYGLWFESTSQGHLLELTVVLHFGDEARPTMKSYWFWHPGRQETIYQEIQRSGTLREGTCHFEDDKTFVTLTEVFRTTGSVAENRGVNVMTEANRHDTTAYAKGPDGAWVEQASLSWIRTPQESAPSQP